MNKELMEALDVLEKEKEISKETLFEAIENSLMTACKNHFGKADNVHVEINRETCDFLVYAEKEVVPTKDDVEDDCLQIALEDAQEISKRAQVGDMIHVEIKSKEFGRIATQNAKNVILQKIREEERSVIYNQYYEKEKDVVTGVVQRYVGKNISINLGKADAMLTENEQVKGEVFKPTERIKVYIVEVKNTPKGPRINVSRTHPELVKRLFESEVTEIKDGTVEIKSKEFGRIATQNAKNVILQKIREEERSVIYNQYYEKEKDVVTGVVQRYVGKNISINLGKADAMLTENEQVKGEVFKPTERIKVYIVEVKNTPKGPRINVSRTHPELVKRLFESEVTEIKDGTVEIKSIAREAGSRTKIAVWSNNPNVDAVGACVGMNGARVNAIVEELRGEKIDIVNWDENPGNLIQNALSPAKIVAVFADPDEKTAKVVVPDYQLSLAIGKEGQNARLAARLTGYKIDIKSETQAKDAPGFRYEDYVDDYEDETEDDFDGEQE